MVATASNRSVKMLSLPSGDFFKCSILIVFHCIPVLFKVFILASESSNIEETAKSGKKDVDNMLGLLLPAQRLAKFLTKPVMGYRSNPRNERKFRN